MNVSRRGFVTRVAGALGFTAAASVVGRQLLPDQVDPAEYRDQAFRKWWTDAAPEYAADLEALNRGQIVKNRELARILDSYGRPYPYPATPPPPAPPSL